MPHKNIRLRFGARVRKLRQRKCWGQMELAVESGLSREMISKVENGRVDPSLTTVEALAGSFRMTVSQLMRGV